MTNGEARSLELIRAWEKYREGIEFELEQVKRRAKMLRADIEHSEQQIRKAIKSDDSQLTLEGMDDVGFPPSRASWRDATLEVVLGNVPALKKLNEKSIYTLGDLSDLTNGGGSLIQHCGLTEQQEAAVLDAMNIYFGNGDANN